MTTYVALLDGGKREVAIDVVRRSPGRYEVRVGDALHVVDAHAHGPEILSLLVDTRAFTATLDARGPKVHVRLGGAPHAIELLDEARLRLRRGAGRLAAAGAREVSAPLAGRIAKLLVRPGEAVARGQPLAILYAMKMENELRSPAEGRVGAVFVKEGDAVDAHARVCTVE